MEQKVLEYIRKNNLINKGDKVLLGISGGADSVCLLYILNELKSVLGINLQALHVHHGLRGESADNDAKYVEKLCDKLKVQFVLREVNVKGLVKDEKLSLEEAARKLRYEAFFEVAKEYGCDKIAVAHHGDDQAETILFQMFRGSGLKGLSGMKSKRDDIIRPFLCVSRCEIEEYLKDRNIEFCTDETNLEAVYSRNKIRLELLPYIKENINEKIITHLNALARDAYLADEFIQKSADRLFESFGKFEEDSISLDLAVFDEAQIVVTYLIRKCIMLLNSSLKDIGRVHIEAVYRLAFAKGNKEINLPYSIVVKKEYGKLIFLNYENIKIEDNCKSKISPDEVLIDKDCIMSTKNEKVYEFGEYKVSFKVENLKKNQFVEKKTYTKYFDYDTIKNVLSLRTRRKGDFLVINNQGGTKKLKDYFIDEKIPKNNRDDILLLADESSVLWAVGYRISERYKLTENTQRILKVTVENRKHQTEE